MKCYDSIPVKNEKDVEVLKNDLDNLLAGYAGLITWSKHDELAVFAGQGDDDPVIIRKFYEDSCRVWFSGVPEKEFVSALDKLKEKYK